MGGTGVVDVDPFGGFAFNKVAINNIFDGRDTGEEARKLGAGHSDGS